MADKYSLQEANAAAGSSFTSKVVLGCLLFTTTVAIIGMVLSCIALTKYNAPQPTVATPGTGSMKGGTSGTGGTSNKVTINISPASNKKDRYYTIAHGHDWHAHEYLDTGGVVRGFSLAMIKAVCTAAKMKCFTMWEPYTNCWKSVVGQHQRTGKGLQGRWYDGCIGWSVSTTRNQSVAFTDSYLGQKPAYLYRRTSVSGSWTSVLGKNVGFMDGWVDDEKCLARQKDRITGAVLPATQVKHFATTPELVSALISGKIDFAFGGTELSNVLTGANKNKVTKGSTGYYCNVRGNSVMARKDNVDFMESWNKGFRIIQKSGQFKQMCDSVNANSTNPVPIDCI